MAQRHRNTSTRRRKKSSSKSPFSIIAIILLLAAVAYIAARPTAEDAPVAVTPADKLLTVVMPDSIPSVIKAYDGFTVSFNPRMHIPNWVAWELTGAETDGKEPRANSFAADPDVEGCPETYDYMYSGYDRGHMAPAADMKWSPEAMRQSFYLTNICPQAKDLNTGAWRTLEQSTRKWAVADSAIVIIAGPILTPAPHEYLGDNRVAVPRQFFKVILSPYSDPVKAIAFIMPNGKVAGGMQRAITTIDEVERLTGLDFFAELPDSLENRLESHKSNLQEWNRNAGKRR